MNTRPDPLIPSDVDIRGFSGFMLNVERLLASELVALGTPEECWSAMMLWCRAWQQHPAASLPNDDRVLAAFSGAGKRWPKVKEVALRGFVLCSDGRLYHRVLAGEVMSAWKKRQAYQNDQERLRKWRETRRKGGSETPHEATGETPDETRFETVSSGVSEQVDRDRDRDRDRDSRKKDSEVPSGTSAAGAAPRDPVAELFELAVELFGSRGRSLVGKARKDFGQIAVMQALLACRDEGPSEPVPFFLKCLEARKKSNVRRSAHADETAAFEAVTRR